MTDPATNAPGTAVPEARRQRTRWPGWVWLIPLVALVFAGWLAVQEWVVGPSPLTVHFASVEGIKPGAPVRYKGVQVGSVDAIRLDDDLGGATLVLDMTALEGRLGRGTRVWIERPSLASGQIGGLLSGAYLAIAPEAGPESDALQGLDEPPIVMPDEPGRVFVLTDETAEGLAAGAPVRLRGLQVGRVLGKRFGADGAVEIPVFVAGEFAELVREATVFWRAGGVAVDTAGGLDVDLPSLSTMATGAIAFDTPEVLAGAPADAGARFPLWDTRDDAASTPSGPRLPYLIVFAEPVGDLARGAPVTLAGRRIGRVVGAGLEVAPDGGGLITPVTIVIDARRLEIDGLAALDSREALRARLNEIVGQLVAVGMRARIAEGGIVFGARSVELVIDPGAAPAAFSPEAPVPATPAAAAARGPDAAGGAAGAGGARQAPDDAAASATDDATASATDDAAASARDDAAASARDDASGGTAGAPAPSGANRAGTGDPEAGLPDAASGGTGG